MIGEQQLAEGPYIELPGYLSQNHEDKPQDECGVFAIYAPGTAVAFKTYQALQGLQHRGQSAAGIAVADSVSKFVDFTGQGLPLRIQKGVGLVPQALGAEVYPLHEQGTSRLDLFKSDVAIGHTRYSTAMGDGYGDVQPFGSWNTSFALAHNGHIDGMERVAKKLGVPLSGELTDSAMLFNTIHYFAEQLCSLEKAVAMVLSDLEGAFCITATDGKRIIAATDPWGFHPLALGRLTDDKGYVVSSESVIFDSIGAEYVRDIEPGEMIIIDENGVESFMIADPKPRRECMFEYAYTARPDGIINGVDVYQTRKNLGRHLAEDYPVEADVVVGVPSSGLAAASGYAEVSGLALVEGLIKNPYVQRTFIERGDQRKIALSEKFWVNPSEVCGKRVVLVDDSLIKGNTMRQLIGMLHIAGATEVHVRSSAPRYENPCYMGMDTGDANQLIARKYTNEEIAQVIKAASVAFNTVERFEQAVDKSRVSRLKERALGSLCTACATGEYPFPVGEDARKVASKTGSVALASLQGLLRTMPVPV